VEDKMFDLVSKMYSEMKQGFAEVNGKMEVLSKQVINLENDLKPKVEALFDGYKQHTDMLEHIKNEVSRQDEIIMRRIK
jgi:uncharacterized protein YukE